MSTLPDPRSLARIGFGIATAAGVVALSLGSAGTLTLPAWAIVLSAAATGVGTAGTPIAESMIDRGGTRKLKHANDVGESLRGAIASSADGDGGFATIGASLYLVQKSGRPLRREQRLQRTAYEHLQMALAPAPPSWKKGEGIVGTCWEQKSAGEGLQPNEGVVAVAVTDSDQRVLGVVSLGTSTAAFESFNKSRARVAAQVTAKTLSRVLGDYGIRGA